MGRDRNVRGRNCSESNELGAPPVLPEFLWGPGGFDPSLVPYFFLGPLIGSVYAEWVSAEILLNRLVYFRERKRVLQSPNSTSM